MKQKDDDDVKRNAEEKNGIKDMKIDELRCGSMNHSEADEEKKETGDDDKKNKDDNEAQRSVDVRKKECKKTESIKIITKLIHTASDSRRGQLGEGLYFMLL